MSVMSKFIGLLEQHVNTEQVVYEVLRRNSSFMAIETIAHVKTDHT